MKKINLGILGTSEIAFRRFLPALKKSDKFEYVGVASRNINKTKKFTDEFSGIGYSGYDELINDKNIDAVYIPLPPSLHYEWAIKSLNAGKHVLLEKPFTTSLLETQKIIELAKNNNLAVHENYMFEFHNQLDYAKTLITNKALGDLRLIRIAFGFPKRDKNDFRYNKQLGGGALLDCGGYAIKLASILLGNNVDISACKLNFTDEYDVDLFGSATLENEDGLVAQISFGMDNSYKCELELWGSCGNAKFPRIFTAPSDYKPIITITKDNKENQVVLGEDDQFYNSIKKFEEYILCENTRYDIYNNILMQSSLIQLFLDKTRR